MAKNYLTSISTDQDSQKGNLSKGAQSEDYKRSGTVTLNLASPKIAFHLTAVADGGGNFAPDQSAKLAIDTVFAECARGPSMEMDRILRDALNAANNAVYQQRSGNGSDHVGITLIAITNDRVYLGQVGQITRAFLVRGNEKQPLTGGSEYCLGDSSTQPEIYVERVSEAIKQGDRIVVCSDGLFDPPEDDGLAQKEIVEKIEAGIPVVGQYDNIHGSARHLTSLAKGLDVSDDITVVVIGIGRLPKGNSRVLPLALAGAAIVTLLVIAIISLKPREAPRPPDYGLAVLVSGDASSVDSQTGSQNSVPALSQINPGTTLIISQGSPAALKLKRRTDTQGSNTEIVTGVDLYLSEQTEVMLTTLDLAPFVGDQDKPTKPELVNLTEITLIYGKTLIRSAGGREYAVLLPANEQKKNSKFVLPSSGAGILGVALDEGSSAVDAYCLSGICEYIPASGDSITLSSPSKTTVDLGNSSVLSADAPIRETDWQTWNSLCSGNQPKSCDLSQ